MSLTNHSTDSGPMTVSSVIQTALDNAKHSISDTPWMSDEEGDGCPVAENELVGEPIDAVPKRSPGNECNARRSDGGEFVGYCANRAGKGTDHVGEGRCSFHGGAADNTGPANANYRHGAYSQGFHESFIDFLEEEHHQLIEQAFTDPAAWQKLGCCLAAFALIKYRRSLAQRHLREFEVICDTFGLLPCQEGGR